MTLNITIQQQGDFGEDAVKSAIADSLSRELKQAIGRRDYFKSICRTYELRYGMTTDDFVQSFEAGAIGDDEDFFDWFGNKHLLDSWDLRVRILAGATIAAD